MYVIIWGYQVKAGCIPEFEKIYYSNGAWAELFRKAPGYISTELLRAEINHQRFVVTPKNWTEKWQVVSS